MPAVLTAQPAAPETAPSFALEYDEWGQLIFIAADGTRHVGATTTRAFPIADPDRWISICDASGKELACIQDLAQLPAELRQLVESDLATREFVPVIQRVHRLSGYEEPIEWTVETDRGLTTFLLTTDDDIRRIGPHQALLLDAHGVRYLIRDIRQLDAHSQRVLDRFF